MALCATCKETVAIVEELYKTGKLIDTDHDEEDAAGRHCFVHMLYCEGRQCGGTLRKNVYTGPDRVGYDTLASRSFRVFIEHPSDAGKTLIMSYPRGKEENRDTAIVLASIPRMYESEVFGQLVGVSEDELVTWTPRLPKVEVWRLERVSDVSEFPQVTKDKALKSGDMMFSWAGRSDDLRK